MLSVVDPVVDPVEDPEALEGSAVEGLYAALHTGRGALSFDLI